MRKPFFIKIVGDFVWEQGVQRFGIDDSLDEYLVKKEQPLIVRFLRWGQKFIAGRAKKIIVPSNYLKNVVLSWGIREENIVVVYNAFEEDAIASISVENKKISGKIISIGRMVPWKGFNALIYTILNLKKYMDISLVIAGDGPDRKKIENLIVENNLSSVVKLLGNIEKNKLREEIVSSELFVLNTGYEGFSHSLLEVMNLEVPVITTNVGGNPEIVENGVDGILVPYNDTSALEQAIQSLFKDKVKMQTIAKNGKEKVRQFNLEKMIKDTILVFK